MPEPDWADISTAPKDGTWLRYVSANGKRLQPLAWMWSENAQRHAWCGIVSGCVLPHDPQPTYWMAEESVMEDFEFEADIALRLRCLHEAVKMVSSEGRDKHAVTAIAEQFFSWVTREPPPPPARQEQR